MKKPGKGKKTRKKRSFPWPNVHIVQTVLQVHECDTHLLRVKEKPIDNYRSIGSRRPGDNNRSPNQSPWPSPSPPLRIINNSCLFFMSIHK